MQWRETAGRKQSEWYGERTSDNHHRGRIPAAVGKFDEWELSRMLRNLKSWTQEMDRELRMVWCRRKKTSHLKAAEHQKRKKNEGQPDDQLGAGQGKEDGRSHVSPGPCESVCTHVEKSCKDKQTDNQMWVSIQGHRKPGRLQRVSFDLCEQRTFKLLFKQYQGKSYCYRLVQICLKSPHWKLPINIEESV